MKKILALILSFAIIFSSVSSVIAVSADDDSSDDLVELNFGFKGFQDTLGVKYAYYSPVKDENDTTKYPLFIYMPGIGESNSLEKALYAGIGNLAAEQYQSNVAGVKGAYIMQMVGSNLCPPHATHSAIKKFVESNPNVDKTRIYVSAWCYGVPFAVDVVTLHPNYYAGLCIYSPFAIVFPGRLATLRNTRIWIFGSMTDLLSFYPLTLLAYVSAILAAKDNKNVRLTSCTAAPCKGPGISHYIWKLVYGDYDEASQVGIKGLRTRDGSGEKIDVTSILGWMSEWTTQGEYVAPTAFDTST